MATKTSLIEDFNLVDVDGKAWIPFKKIVSTKVYILYVLTRTYKYLHSSLLNVFHIF